MPKKLQKKINKSTATIKPPKPKPKPEWVSSFVNQEQYKLSIAEYQQKKVSLISKHKNEVKDYCNTILKKLQEGVKDDETKKIYDTALESKGLTPKYDVVRRNLKEMIHLEKTQKGQNKEFLKKIQDDLKETKKFIEKAEKHKIVNNTSSTISVATRSIVCEEYQFGGLQHLDDMINFLQDKMQSPSQRQQDDQQTELHFSISQQQSASPYREEPLPMLTKKLDFEDFAHAPANLFKHPPANNPFDHPSANPFDQPSANPFGHPPANPTKYFSPQVPIAIEESAITQFMLSDDEPTFDDNLDQLRRMLEQTRCELSQMNLGDQSVSVRQNKSISVGQAKRTFAL